MYRRTTPTRAGSAPEAPALQGDGHVFRSRAELLEVLHRVASRPGQVDSADIRTERDVSRQLGAAARRPGGGVVWLRPVTDEAARHLDRWLAARAPEHAPDAIDGPYKARVAGEPEGLVVGVAENSPPTFWEDLDPDRWPVGAPLSSIDGALLAQLCARQPFSSSAATRRSWDNEADLLSLDAARLVRGFVQATLAGCVALAGWSLHDLPGMRFVFRLQDGSVRQVAGHRRRMVADALAETRWWAGLPPGAAALALHFALAERAWGGPDAAKPITLSRDGARLRLSVPTTPANQRERETAGPANPLLRRFLMALGDLPGWDEEVGVADNPLVLESLRGHGVQATMQELGGETRVELWAERMGCGAGAARGGAAAQPGPEADRGARTRTDRSGADQGARAQPAGAGAARGAGALGHEAPGDPRRGSEGGPGPAPVEAQARRGAAPPAATSSRHEAAPGRRGSAGGASRQADPPSRQVSPASAARGDPVASGDARDDGRAASTTRGEREGPPPAVSAAGPPEDPWIAGRLPEPPGGEPAASRRTAAARDLQDTSGVASRMTPSALEEGARGLQADPARDESSCWEAPSSASPAAPSPALNLEDRKAQILDLLSARVRPLSLKEIAEALCVQRDTPRKALAALVADGLLALTDPNPRSPQQRYRLVR